MKKIILILLLFCTTKQILVAQTVTSTLTQLTTDLLQGDERSNFNWRTIKLEPLRNNIFSSGRFGEFEDCGTVGVLSWRKITTDGLYGYGDYWVWGMCTETGWHGSLIMVKSSILVDALFGQFQGGGVAVEDGSIPPSTNTPPAGWEPPTPSNMPPTNQGGGIYNPNDPTNTHSTAQDPEHPIKEPVKPVKSLAEDGNNDIPLIPTVKIIEPEGENCNSVDSSKGLTLTKQLDSMETTPQMQDLRANLNNRKFEVGFVINKYTTSMQARNYDTLGIGRSVSAHLEKFSTADVHSHPADDSAKITNVPSPSAPDFMSLVDGYHTKFDSIVKRYDTNNVYTHSDTIKVTPYKAQTTYAIAAGPPPTDFAINIDSPALAKAFYANPHNRLDSIMNIDGKLNSWKGTDKDIKTLRGKFFQRWKSLIDDGYSKENAEYYAQLIMSNDLGMGIAAYKKVDGKFRKLRVEKTADGKHYKLFICNN